MATDDTRNAAAKRQRRVTRVQHIDGTESLPASKAGRKIRSKRTEDLEWLRRRAVSERRGRGSWQPFSQRRSHERPFEIIVELKSLPELTQANLDALAYFGFHGVHDELKKRVVSPFTFATAENARRIQRHLRLSAIYLPPSKAKAHARGGNIAPLESYGTGGIDRDKFEGERLDPNPFEYLRVERGLGVTTLAWTTTHKFEDVADTLHVREIIHKQDTARLNISGVNNNLLRILDAGEALELAIAADDTLRYVSIPCNEFDVVWRRLSPRQSADKFVAEVALVYDSVEASPNTYAITSLGSTAVQSSLDSFVSESKLLSGR